MKVHEIKLEDLQKWIETMDVTFASSTRERKRLIITLKNGHLRVSVAGTIVWQGTDLASAVEAYNAIAKKYVDPIKDFRI